MSAESGRRIAFSAMGLFFHFSYSTEVRDCSKCANAELTPGCHLLFVCVVCALLFVLCIVCCVCGRRFYPFTASLSASGKW